jgi:protein-S-isoprenylcysteine O-methyltransferase Ste14
MRDLPEVFLTATVWAYWLGIGMMIVRARRKTRQLAGLVPEQRLERFMWVVWVPLVAAWVVFPYLALVRSSGPFALPAFAQENPGYAGMRWIAAICAVICLLLTSLVWSRMGTRWRMAVSLEGEQELITDGPFRFVRHPIYALSMLLMLCSAIVVPSAPMLVVALVHLVLLQLKARNEEAHLLALHGEAYRAYLARTGRFFPKRG